MINCKYCNKECKNKISLAAHQRSCPENIDRKYFNYMTGKKGKNQFSKAEELGLNKPIVTKQTRKKLKIASQKQVWTEERRKKHSSAMKLAVLKNPDSYTTSNVCGRVKIEKYKGENFHGKWEIIVAKFFDKNNIKWERKTKPIQYYWNNNHHLYFPDFYLPEHDLFVEVKGYETDRDHCKWSAISNLLVIKKSEIKQIKEGKYALVTHLVESAPLIREEAGFKSLTTHQTK
jgi:hypothetical protein